MTAGAPPALVLQGVSWEPVAGRRVLDEVDLACHTGRVTGLLGPNGSGKTTVLRVAAGLRRPDAGRVSIAGADLARMRPRERARLLALVEQESSTSLDLTVRDVVRLGRTPHRPRFASWRDDEGDAVVESAMATARVGHLAERSWARLSGGERQRTHLARALAQQPRLLLLDEPTNHLDLGHQLDFLARVRELGVSTVAALHDLELAAAYCDDVAVLDHGRVVASGPAAEVLTSDLVERVYAVEADVEPHPRRPRPHVRWNDVLSERLEEADR